MNMILVLLLSLIPLAASQTLDDSFNSLTCSVRDRTQKSSDSISWSFRNKNSFPIYQYWKGTDCREVITKLPNGVLRPGETDVRRNYVGNTFVARTTSGEVIDTFIIKSAGVQWDITDRRANSPAPKPKPPPQPKPTPKPEPTTKPEPTPKPKRDRRPRNPKPDSTPQPEVPSDSGLGSVSPPDPVTLTPPQLVAPKEQDSTDSPITSKSDDQPSDDDQSTVPDSSGLRGGDALKKDESETTSSSSGTHPAITAIAIIFSVVLLAVVACLLYWYKGRLRQHYLGAKERFQELRKEQKRIAFLNAMREEREQRYHEMLNQDTSRATPQAPPRRKPASAWKPPPARAPARSQDSVLLDMAMNRDEEGSVLDIGVLNVRSAIPVGEEDADDIFRSSAPNTLLFPAYSGDSIAITRNSSYW